MDRSRRRELLALNQRAWDGETDVFPVNSSLDSSLKKNTAFIKRLRTVITSSTLNTFLQEIRTLSLLKYLSEIISACYEGLTRLKTTGEIEAAVEIVSALHQRFGPEEFTEYLGWLLGKGMATPDKSLLKSLAPEVREKEEKERLVRQRALLRVITELWLLGVLRTLDDVKPDDATRGVSGKNAELKIKSTSSTKGGGAEPFPLEVLKDLLGHDRDHVNLPLLVIFVKSFSWDILGVKSAGSDGRKTVEEDGATRSTEDRIDNEGQSSETGVLDPDDLPFATPEMQERFRNILKRYFEDVKAHILRDQKNILTQKGRNSEAYVKSGEVFEDRQANFERLLKAQERLVGNAQVIAEAIGVEMPDLKEAGDGLSTSNGSIGLVKTGEYLRGQSDGAGIWEDEDERRFYENLVDLKGKVPGMLLEDGKKKKADTDEQVGKRIDTPESIETPKPSESIDEQSMAIANKTIGAQVDAILARLPELTNKDAIDEIAIDFCFLNSKASRNRLIKALTEVPKGRTDLLPFWSRLVATLGRYMADVPKGVVEYLDAEFRSLQRRKDKDFLGQVRLSNIRYLAELTKFGVVPEHHIGQPERMLIENAIYYVDPPERASIQQKERTPTELFIRKLIYVDLTKRNYTKILKQIRRLHWEEPEVVAIITKVFSKPGKVKYGSIHILAILLSAIYRYHPDFAVTVIDNVIESINFGLEQNDFKFNQRRIAEVKYLGELYNYRMLEHPVIFDTMYKVMTFGHDDYFRIRLTATVLETCGMFFNRGAAGKKLDYFLSFLQHPLPMDIEFIVQDTFSLTRPQWKLATNLEEASKAFQLAITQDQKNAGLDKSTEQDDASSDASSDDDGAEGDGDMILPEAEGDEEEIDSEDEDIENDHNGDSQPQSPQGFESEDEAIVVTRKTEEVDPEDEEDFEREYAKMMAESLESRKFDRKPLFDVPLPTRTVALPSDSTFAIAMKTQQQAEREEQQRIKNLVLNYDLRHEKPPYHPNRLEKSGKERSGQRVRRLQLSDVDWYGKTRERKEPSENASITKAEPVGRVRLNEAAVRVEESASQPTKESALNKRFVNSADCRSRSANRKNRTGG
ncbi:putative nonsense-mediated mrna decay factor protein [Eutypa lata UCREL1]|uniref:Putative nonsense-mediated mrna decay factor protein n=1 Tax=Eutypa lata (strain UCR-EL1) TaxID=1287681 RepID=M7SCC2_EUTLA|nr:putative nonsense-mediated mrna decay factor protein [Eutypa lata UCREL1]